MSTDTKRDQGPGALRQGFRVDATRLEIAPFANGVERLAACDAAGQVSQQGYANRAILLLDLAAVMICKAAGHAWRREGIRGEQVAVMVAEALRAMGPIVGAHIDLHVERNEAGNPCLVGKAILGTGGQGPEEKKEVRS